MAVYAFDAVPLLVCVRLVAVRDERVWKAESDRGNSVRKLNDNQA